MDTSTTAGALLISGSFIFGVGATVGVPRVFTEPDARSRRRMLEKHLVIWRIAQPMYGLGGLIAAVGVGYLAVGARAGLTQTVLTASCVTLVARVPRARARRASRPGAAAPWDGIVAQSRHTV